MNYWQFKISNKSWIKSNSEEYMSLKDKNCIYQQKGVYKHKMNNCIGNIVFHYNSDATRDFPKGIYLISEITSNVFEEDGKSCIKLKVLKDLRKYPYDYENDYIDIHENYNTTKIRGRTQNYEIIDEKFNPNNIYNMIIGEKYSLSELNIPNSLNVNTTEFLNIESVRIGQKEFRQKLIDYWNGCAVTTYNITSILVASHIKPWKSSNNNERLDVYNGLLLLPNLDKLFDRGYITFNNKGKIVISSQISDYEILGINNKMKIKVEKNHEIYLQYHRKNIFIK
jgi:hypothetical protein